MDLSKPLHGPSDNHRWSPYPTGIPLRKRQRLDDGQLACLSNENAQRDVLSQAGLPQTQVTRALNLPNVPLYAPPSALIKCKLNEAKTASSNATERTSATAPLRSVGNDNQLPMQTQTTLQPWQFQPSQQSQPQIDSEKLDPALRADFQPRDSPNTHPPLQAAPPQQQELEAEQFPHATARIGKLTKHGDKIVGVNKLPNLDYCFPIHSGGKPLSFTAVELITFLPRYYRNKDVALRLLNSGMSNMVHFEIHKAFRRGASHLDGMSCAGISNGYLDAMRGANWRYLPKDIQSTWNRKMFKKPHNYKCTVDMNGIYPNWVHEGGSAEPPPVPFVSLLQGVQKMPSGFDAADLTRAIEYAIANPSKEGVWMFPTDLSAILDNIGRTLIGPPHQDDAVSYRYGRQRKGEGFQKKPTKPRSRKSSNANNDGALVRAPDPILGPEGFAVTSKPWDLHYTPNKASRPQDVADRPPDTGNARTELSLLDPQLLMQQCADKQIEYSQKAISQHHLGQQPQDPSDHHTLLRNFNLAECQKQNLRSASIVEFAQRSDQQHKDWLCSPNDIETIRKILASIVPPDALPEAAAKIVDNPHVEVISTSNTAPVSYVRGFDPTQWEFDVPLADSTLSGMPMTSDEWNCLFREPASKYMATESTPPSNWDWQKYGGTCVSLQPNGPPPPESAQSPASHALQSTFEEAASSSTTPPGSLCAAPAVQAQENFDELRGHGPLDMLKDCKEADDLNEDGVLARAARIARTVEFIDQGWCVQDMELLVDLRWSEYVREHGSAPDKSL